MEKRGDVIYEKKETASSSLHTSEVIYFEMIMIRETVSYSIRPKLPYLLLIVLYRRGWRHPQGIRCITIFYPLTPRVLIGIDEGIRAHIIIIEHGILLYRSTCSVVWIAAGRKEQQCAAYSQIHHLFHNIHQFVVSKNLWCVSSSSSFPASRFGTSLSASLLSKKMCSSSTLRLGSFESK